MKTMLAILVMTVAATAIAQQTNTLDTLRHTYESRQQSFLIQYGKALDAAMADLKRRGDLDNVLILQEEQKRFDAYKTVPAPTDAKDSFRPVTEAYFQAMVTMQGQYVTALDRLVKKETAADRIAEAQMVKAEKDKASFVLADMQTKLSMKAVVEKPKTEELEKPVSSPSAYRPKTYVDETKGFAGIGPKGNIYTFQVESVGKKATFRFWASGDISTDTSGQVLLTGPDAQEQIIRQWKPSDFRVAANSVSSYKKLKPISCDISAYVKQAGEYQITFRWGGSPAGLSILRVELELQ